jgi:hypothetical protein
VRAALAGRLRVLELDLTSAMVLPPTLGAALPGLRSLTLANYRNGGHGLERALGPRGCTALTALRLLSLYCSALPGLTALRALRRLELAGCWNLREAPEGPSSLEVRPSAPAYDMTRRRRRAAGSSPGPARLDAPLHTPIPFASLPCLFPSPPLPPPRS